MAQAVGSAIQLVESEGTQMQSVETLPLQELKHELHGMCQPLTVLQCRLELGRMMGDQESLLEAVDEAASQVERLFTAVERMRALLIAATDSRVLCKEKLTKGADQK